MEDSSKRPLSELTEGAVREASPDGILDVTLMDDGALSVRLKAGALMSVCDKLRRDLGFDYLADITAIDWQDRIEVVYHLTALDRNEKVVLRTDLDRDRPEIDSVTRVWKGAEFQEREVYDLMGVVFGGHPDLRRILLPDEWEGHPLRKDYVIPDQD